jgi:hypothetical protein
MKQVTDYYFDLQNITDIHDCSENCNDNLLIMFKQIIEPILKDNDDYDITILDNESELFKMTGGDGTTTFPYKQFEEMMKLLFQHSKFIEEKKDELYNSLFTVEKNNVSNVSSEIISTPPPIESDAPSENIEIPQTIDAALPVIDNNSNNPHDITQPPSKDIGVYKKMQQNLFKHITNVITVKLSIYNNNFKNSFIKKIRYSQ